MKLAQQSQFSVVIGTLVKSADLVKNQRKEEAIKTILGISDEIQFLSDTSKTRESEYKDRQKEFTKLIQDIIKREAEVRQKSIDTQKSIDALNVQINAKATNERELIAALNSLETQMRDHEAELRAHQAKLDDLNDDSAGSIVISIFTLGIDRAVKGIATLVNQDQAKINALRPEINSYRDAVQKSKVNLIQTKNLLAQLQASKRSSEATVTQLKKREEELNQNEKACRQKLGFFTNVALFYGKLVIVAQQVDNRIDDVVDIIEELDDDTPTIIDFDGSGEDLISLKEALEKFDTFLDSEPVWLESDSVGLAGRALGIGAGTVGIFSEDGKWRLDIGTRAMKENVPATYDSWATRLVIKRLDGPDSGPISDEHVVGIFSLNELYRLDIGTRATKENVPASHESWATRLRVIRLSSASSGPINYGDVVGIFSEDGKWRLDIGTRATKESVPASHESWATRLKFRHV